MSRHGLLDDLGTQRLDFEIELGGLGHELGVLKGRHERVTQDLQAIGRNAFGPHDRANP